MFPVEEETLQEYKGIHLNDVFYYYYYDEYKGVHNIYEVVVHSIGYTKQRNVSFEIYKQKITNNDKVKGQHYMTLEGIQGCHRDKRVAEAEYYVALKKENEIEIKELNRSIFLRESKVNELDATYGHLMDEIPSEFI